MASGGRMTLHADVALLVTMVITDGARRLQPA
jgi:hypothetical protein